MRLLITGSSGLIGNAFYENYLYKYQKIFCLTRSKSNLSSEINIDLSNDFFINLDPVDIILHTAAQTSANIAYMNPLTDLNTNVGGLIRIVENYRKQGLIPFIIFLGNATQIGMTNSIEEAEINNCDNPITFYDLSKNTAENYLMHYIREGLIEGCALRLCNVYGTAGSRQNADRGILDKMMRKALVHNDLSVFGDGSYVRDYIHLDDVISAIDFAICSREKLNGQTHVIGTGVGTTLLQAFEMVAEVASEVTGHRVAVNCVEPYENLSEIEFRSFVADSKEFQRITGWQPKLRLREGLRRSYRQS